MNQDTPNPTPSFTPAPPPSPYGPQAQAPAPRVEPPLPETLNLRTLFEALLRSPRALVRRLADPGHGALLPFLGIAILSLLVFGAVLGSFAMGTQMWAAPLKITVGLLIAGVICFPSLYIFSCLAGSQAGASQLAATFAGMMALAGLLLLGFAPAVWIFTQATNSLGFMGVLALASWFIALIFGFRFLKDAVGSTGAISKGPVTVWSIIFLLVTLQMTTSLRPILGRESWLLTDEKKFFIQHWIESAGKELPSKPKPATADATPQ
ncbi:hypothetical protein OKA05_25125 [Luteolibacter arcticus]|uniref:Yip1 domain-containing protein n=1 Tax=Luteolibacter arcticus TaxID=1581411 RepID=A0ABT3GQR0_9BACT|nr:hypothetical protein [Luteolibacter arcticus]MCW1925866.1 hypothetical protein [Luteolibacter arcticus]